MFTEVAPGARVLCRDAEWLVRSAARSSDGRRVIETIGVSEFIRGRTARFVEDLEADLQILQPEDTELIADNSSGYRNSLLFIEAQLRQATPDDQKIYLGQRAAMDTLAYQLLPAYKALQMPRQRILIADAVGLGKTLECGILVSELIRRGRGRRILVITSKSMMVQFQKELWTRFTIPLVRLDSVEIQRIRSRIPGNHNPFHYYDRSIISVDTLKQDREYRSYLENAYWDIIIIDEAHNVARRGKGQGFSQRAKLAERLSTRSDTLILLSATPHDGRPESFASLMNMLDPTAIANESNYTKDDIRDLYVRRFKKDVLLDLRKHVPERNVESIEAQASIAEERVFGLLNDLKLEQVDRRRTAGQLFKTTLLKAMLSSPMACLETVNHRLKRLVRESGSAADIQELETLREALLAIGAQEFSKYQRLLHLIQKEFRWTGKDKSDRIVIFAGRLETLRFLKEQLPIDLKLNPEAIVALDGGMPDVEQNQIVESFGQENAKVRILVCTEVASEGLNLHYLSHKLIHADIPWSLMTLQQRNGRIDRYGQTRQPEIRYLLTRSRNERMDEVERIVKVLLQKDEQAIKNIGDPSVFMGVFDADAEEAVTATAIESGTTADAFSQQLDRNAANGGEFDLFAWFENPETIEQPETPETPEEGKLLSLFPSTYEFAVEAIQALETPPQNLSIRHEDRFIELQMPSELERRYERLPREIRPKSDQLLQLSANPQAILRSLEEARRQEATWAPLQYLWDLHPFVEWLSDRCLFRFGRHQATVLLLSEGLVPQESTFVFFGSFPNQHGSPVMNRSCSVVFEAGKFQRIESFEATVQRTGIGKRLIPNPGAAAVGIEELLPLRSQAVAQVRKYLLKERETFEAVLAPRLREQQERLNRLKGEHVEQLELRIEGDTRSQSIKAQRKQSELNRLEKIFQDYEDWVKLSMTTEPAPYIKLIAVLRRNE